jgi:hypothetical protein
VGSVATKVLMHGVIVLRLLIGTVFVYTGAVKAIAPASFYQSVQNYRLVSDSAAATIAAYLPWLEITCGAGLMFRQTRHGAALLLTCACILFLGVQLSAWWRGLRIACGCFGAPFAGTSVFIPILLDSLLLVGLLLIQTQRKNRNGRTEQVPNTAKAEV